jgi:hypothetical protein
MSFASVIIRAVVLAQALASCANDQSATSSVTASGAPARPAFKVQGFLPEAPGEATASGSTEPERFNDPSAPLDTPLCGVAARERNAVSVAVVPAVASSGNACLQTACFDALTDTYIGADGYRHVCQ